MNKVQNGRKAEDIAEEFLHQKGYKTIKKNFNTRAGEIDLIMKDEEFIVFIEVKSLRFDSFYTIYESLTKKKKLSLRYAVNNWLYKNNKQGEIWRVDFVGIVVGKHANINLEHYKFIQLGY